MSTTTCEWCRYDESCAETPTTPTNELLTGGEPGTPHIPEPDYDVSDSCSGSESGWRDTATLRKVGELCVKNYSVHGTDVDPDPSYGEPVGFRFRFARVI